MPPAQPCDKYDLDWSPDGERIVFSAGEESSGSPDYSSLEIYTVRPDGSDLTRLTNEADRATNPGWAPDGSAIAYQIDAGYLPEGRGAHRSRRIEPHSPVAGLQPGVVA